MTRPASAWVQSSADERAVASGCWFDVSAAERVRRFFRQFLRHSKGVFAGQEFDLLDWQWHALVAPLFGWKRGDGTRRYRRASVWVPKKNGKSTLAAGLILYGLLADGEAGTEVYGAAADRNQAGVIFGEVAAMIAQSPALSSRLEVLHAGRRVRYPARHGFYQVLSKDSKKTGHGVNAHFCVVDELHVVDRDLYQTLRYAGASRRQPLLLEISTAGDDRTSLGYERYQYAKKLLSGAIEDPETLALVFEADGDWTEEAQWQKANPSLGTTISLESFRGDFLEARQGGAAAQASFKQLRLNLWQDSCFSWLAVEEWDACRGELRSEDLEGCACYGGLDLASKLDVCAVVLLFATAPGEYALRCRFFAPAEASSRRQKENRANLLPWAREGYLVLTEGEVTDYDQIEQQILADQEAYRVREWAYDPWNATHVANHLLAEGLRLVEFAQTIRNYNEPMRELERLVRARKIRHDGNPLLRHMVASCVARKDSSGNIRPDKQRSGDHIDGVTALLMALGRALVAARDLASVYEERGLEVL